MNDDVIKAIEEEHLLKFRKSNFFGPNFPNLDCALVITTWKEIKKRKKR